MKDQDRDATIFIRDILDSIHRIERFTQGMEYEDFLQDEKPGMPPSRAEKLSVKLQNTSRLISGHAILPSPGMILQGCGTS